MWSNSFKKKTNVNKSDNCKKPINIICTYKLFCLKYFFLSIFLKGQFKLRRNRMSIFVMTLGNGARTYLFSQFLHISRHMWVALKNISKKLYILILKYICYFFLFITDTTKISDSSLTLKKTEGLKLFSL